jgi:hypothetical protein
MSLDLNQLFMLADKLGVVLLLLLTLIGSYRQWWVSGPSHRQAMQTWQQYCASVEEDRNYWRSGMLRALGVNEKLTDITKHTLPAIRED